MFCLRPHGPRQSRSSGAVQLGRVRPRHVVGLDADRHWQACRYSDISISTSNRVDIDALLSLLATCDSMDDI